MPSCKRCKQLFTILGRRPVAALFLGPSRLLLCNHYKVTWSQLPTQAYISLPMQTETMAMNDRITCDAVTDNTKGMACYLLCWW